MSEIQKDIEGIRTKIEDILHRLPPPPLITGKSPLSLTGFGEEIADKLDAENWANNLAYDIWEDVQEMKDYEVHEYCFDCVRSDDFTGDMTELPPFLPILIYDIPNNLGDFMRID